MWKTPYNILSYRINLHFCNYKLEIEINENGHCDRNIDNKIKRQKAIKQELGCKLIKIDPDKEDFDIFRGINEIFRHIKQSTEKILINEISLTLLELEFKSDNIIKSKAIKYIVKKYCLNISNNGNVLHHWYKIYCKRKSKCYKK